MIFQMEHSLCRKIEGLKILKIGILANFLYLEIQKCILDFFAHKIDQTFYLDNFEIQ